MFSFYSPLLYPNIDDIIERNTTNTNIMMNHSPITKKFLEMRTPVNEHITAACRNIMNER